MVLVVQGTNMIQVRDNGLKRPHTVKEYYLESAGKWMTLFDLSQLEGCEIQPEGLKGRINNKFNNPKFKTLDDCVFTPKMVNGNNNRSNQKKNILNKQEKENKSIGEQSELLSLWPIRKTL